MTSAFEKLPDEKKQRILAICIEEFAKNGYENTSTNRIIQRAGISKGLLFHYFKNKKGLFLYLVQHSIELIADKVYKKLQTFDQTDFFERIRQVSVIKMNVCLIYPNEYQILMKAILDTPKELQIEIEEINRSYYAKVQDANETYLFSYLKEEDLRPGLTKQFVIDYIMNVIDQLNRNMLQAYKGIEKELLVDPDPFLDQLNQYFDVIQYGVYRK
ncbi:TetR/AcrR family transcriptional regulator [Alkalihalobacillus sp. AL-G]|uniref:TetR/AcrR family transcriptional regulator n=1 Tax=Alkalihalobacillus sp. AL-G TaxID=2926399 RepID=UPI00272AA5A6|nr:TetR/AcrR family transcriptional regulator [Alkalihalobacillus sp. AL-G]WLD91570.1 TetR/AcrR family transcriptional regulator [Alkalihalobacillus sp. AL-G]